MERCLEIKDFSLLMLAILADSSRPLTVAKKTIKIAVLPIDYKQIIQNILCDDNGWKEEFSSLINMKEYFSNHFKWEKKLVSSIQEYIDETCKDVKYDFNTDKIYIRFEFKEIEEIQENILNKYKSQETINKMIHFTNLLKDLIFTREYQEEFYDYGAASVKKMRKLNNYSR